MQFPRLIVIANLEHASPRIPSLLLPMARGGWDITLVTPQLSSQDNIKLNIAPEFSRLINVVETGCYSDVYEMPRKIMHALGWVKKNQAHNYTGELQNRLTGTGISSGAIKNILRYYQAIFAYPDTERAWAKLANQCVERELRVGSEPILLSSSPYPIAHIIAQKFAKDYSLRWIADFRDPWSQNHNYQMPTWRKWFDTRLEKRVLSSASLITTVSEGFAEKLSQLHDAPISVVRNGFQPNKIKAIKRDQTETVQIVYTGRIYPEHQKFKLILQALSYIKTKYPEKISKFKLNFFGPHLPELSIMIEELDLNDVVKQNEPISRGDTRELQANSDLLLLFQWENSEEKGIFPLKFYEYMDARNPILATGKGTNEEIVKILNETKSGISVSDVSGIVEYLLQAQKEKSLKGKIKYTGDDNAINNYSFASISKTFAKTVLELNSPK